MTELHADPLALLRTRTSSKWRSYPEDVLPMFVAEMDFPIAPEIAAKLVELIGRSDLGYDSRRRALGESFAGYAKDAWGWEVDPAKVKATTNVVVAMTELLHAAIEPGDRVVLTSPVYPPFFGLTREAGGEVVDVPLLTTGPGEWRLDLDGIEAAFRDDARAFLLCNPHNPVGAAWPRADLERLAELAAEHDVLVLADEIHAPLVHSDAEFIPFLTISDAARETGIALTSASKAFNLPALTCAWWVTASKRAEDRIARLPESVIHRTGHFGSHASEVAFRDSRAWLADCVETLEANRRVLRGALAAQVPEAILHEPRASYLAWIDFRPLGWGDRPQQRILERGRVALNDGVTFGATGKGFARINFATSPELIEEGVRRIALAR